MSIIFSVIVLTFTAGIFALMLAWAAKRFAVKEDPRVETVMEMLPGINCGACGFAGCSGLASALVQAADSGDLSGLFCPPGGQNTMDKVGEFLGVEFSGGDVPVAVLRCGGSCQASPPKVEYTGEKSCKIAHMAFSGEGGCPMGCLHYGDCEVACPFDAISMDSETGLPVVDEEKCTGCGECVKACPRGLFELRPRGKRGRRVWVNCRNTQKGAIARKNCQVACIGCGKCVRTCDTVAKAITMENNLAYIDPLKCIACGKCVRECPTGAILATFPVKKQVSSQEKQGE
ncbi:RnfABCDGE type electron transport complex subunit B [Spirochaetia bacterium 38H-sp]|uniref:Ion-translocating oxidoreductase complex subunit B n=1 Tax=Rarispira pelagica TaxID=3141764 RepID=A0ABU9UD71_9SPIR